MRTLTLLTTLALLALATPVTASDAPEAPVECGWCCFMGQVDYAQCMSTMVYENNEPAGPAGQIAGAYWDATMYSVDVVQAVELAQSAAMSACGWCCGMGTIDYAQCMGEEAYPDVNGPVGDIAGAYWGATMYSVDVVQDNLPASTASVAYGCDGTAILDRATCLVEGATQAGCHGASVQDDAVCFVHGAAEPVLLCDSTSAAGVVVCIADGELENWREFNRRVCDHHLCLHFP